MNPASYNGDNSHNITKMRKIVSRSKTILVCKLCLKTENLACHTFRLDVLNARHAGICVCVFIWIYMYVYMYVYTYTLFACVYCLESKLQVELVQWGS
jgi:hypothetical protein